MDRGNIEVFKQTKRLTGLNSRFHSKPKSRRPLFQNLGRPDRLGVSFGNFSNHPFILRTIPSKKCIEILLTVMKTANLLKHILYFGKATVNLFGLVFTSGGINKGWILILQISLICIHSEKVLHFKKQYLNKIFCK
jgi:hypothetical protein